MRLQQVAETGSESSSDPHLRGFDMGTRYMVYY